jgi:hypothetical protein
MYAMEQPNVHRATAYAIILAAVTTFAFGTSTAHKLNSSQAEVIEFWLNHHQEYRLANDADCVCDSDLRSMRAGYGRHWKPVADYHAYVASGDFNGDGQTDFAVVVLNKSKGKRRFTLLVFNGPFASPEAAPAFVDSELDLTGSGLFYGPPRPKPYRLVVGRFESEGMTLLPHGQTYRKQGFNPE